MPIKDERINKCFALGLKFNGEELCYRDINFHWTDLTCMTDEEFEAAFKGAEERMKAIKLEEEAGLWKKKYSIPLFENGFDTGLTIDFKEGDEKYEKFMSVHNEIPSIINITTKQKTIS